MKKEVFKCGPCTITIHTPGYQPGGDALGTLRNDDDSDNILMDSMSGPGDIRTPTEEGRQLADMPLERYASDEVYRDGMVLGLQALTRALIRRYSLPYYTILDAGSGSAGLADELANGEVEYEEADDSVVKLNEPLLDREDFGPLLCKDISELDINKAVIDNRLLQNTSGGSRLVHGSLFDPDCIARSSQRLITATSTVGEIWNRDLVIDNFARFLEVNGALLMIQDLPPVAVRLPEQFVSTSRRANMVERLHTKGVDYDPIFTYQLAGGSSKLNRGISARVTTGELLRQDILRIVDEHPRLDLYMNNWVTIEWPVEGRGRGTESVMGARVTRLHAETNKLHVVATIARKTQQAKPGPRLVGS